MATAQNKDGSYPTNDANVKSPIQRLGPVERTADVVPSDTVNMENTCNQLYIGGAGTLACVKKDNTVQNYTVPAGAVINGRFKRVNATGTTATLIVAHI